jgi:hypothetical protein
MFEDRRAYSMAEEKAAGELLRLDPEVVALERGLVFDAAASEFRLPFLLRELRITFPGGAVMDEADQPISGAVAVLALHYLVYRGEPDTREGWLAYRDMPGARHFASAFEDMVEKRLATHFGDRPDDLGGAALSLGGTSSDIAEYAFELPAYPRMPLMVVLWPSNEEGQGSAKVLFPPSAPYYFHSEDLAALGVVAAERLIAQEMREIGRGCPY